MEVGWETKESSPPKPMSTEKIFKKNIDYNSRTKKEKKNRKRRLKTADGL